MNCLKPKPIVYLLILILILIFNFNSYHSWVIAQSDREVLLEHVQQRVLLITIDGFRSDYIEDYDLVNFKQLQSQGVLGRYVQPEFPPLTVPSFWSMATGVHAEKHGIVSNTFYDPVLNRKFDKYDYHFSRLKLWSNYNPIWFDAVANGIKTGLLFWPRANEMVYDPLAKKRNIKLSKSLGLNEKLDISIDLFRNGGFQFCLINHNQPGTVSYEHGVLSSKFNESLQELDQSIGYLVKRLSQNFMIDASLDFNVLIVSNHGMADIKRYVILDRYLKKYDAEIWSDTASLVHLNPLINPKHLIKKLNRIKGIKIYKRSQIPEDFHYKNSSRIGDILLHAEEGVAILYMRNKQINNHQGGYLKYVTDSVKSNSGFSKYSKSMAGMFIGVGPTFKQDYVDNSSSTRSIDFKPLLCNILNIACDKKSMDGDLKSMFKYFRVPRRKNDKNMFSNYSQNNYVYLIYVFGLYAFSITAPILITIISIKNIKYQLWQTPELEPNKVGGQNGLLLPDSTEKDVEIKKDDVENA